MPVLQTSRLLCRPLTENDWTFFLTLQKNPDVMRFVADTRTEEEIRIAFNSRLPEWSPGSPHWLCLVLCDKASGAPLGVTGYIHESNECAEVGFLLAPEAQGKGYGTESLHAVCDFAFTTGGLRRLTACVTAGNEASRRLLEKVGFIHEGTLRESYWLHQTWNDDWIFGLLKHDYQPPAA
ncbi:GNAT family N-acetyltransferase [Citrobacter freundii]|uniref:GNAT family N-acetyltransferase n=1 Tax=Citrobacter freundii TaxID=546 RepID=UPI000D130F83|nr:GNAT family N-acetyltransferase [Citrobacter freundii]AVQ91633.1 GNAT family N-acetyltransferase [Citrobacter freundii]EKV5430367.1 GNAT family N-acetyltransferase [Citrobacter freundii]EKY1512842.1 GNAT family N-acetyltransferase [Citrobacter freundii]ELA3555692.1 GNAT family N-acetyltransferase [Citrobacter freundii]ELG9924358.1 GNAT family N-acetyltransferase [Citrobacter freundii]